jgi:hypothetical protein
VTTIDFSTPVNAMSALEIDESSRCDDAWADKCADDTFARFVSSEGVSAAAAVFDADLVDNDGNHSSEEELEEINNKVDQTYFLKS